MNTNGQNAVVSAAYLLYDPNSFQAVSVDTADSVFTSGMEKEIDATHGIIRITRGIPTPGINSANALVAKINFKALFGTTPSSDNFTLSFAAGNNTLSTVIKDDGLGTNILSGVYGGKYTVSGQANPAPVTVVSPPVVSGGSTPTTPTPLPSGAYPESTLLKTADSPKVYVMIQGKKKWIATPEVFETLGYKWTAITLTTDQVLKSIPDYEDNLIRAFNTIQVYLVVNGIRHHVPNPEIFLDYGFAWSDVKDVPVETVNKYALARLIRESKQGKIYYLSAAGIKKWIPTADIFASYNNRWEDIQVISKKEMDSYPVSNLMNYDGKIYLISGTAKKLIPNETILNRYDKSLMLGANQMEWSWYKLGSQVK